MIEIDPRLRTELGHRAEQINVTGDFAARAIAIEHRAHRRRVATTALGGALALAVSAPLVYSAMTPKTVQPVPAASTTAPVPTPSTATPAPTASLTPTAIPTFNTGATPLATASPKLGPATGTPDVPYAVDGVLHDGDRQIPLPVKSSIGNLARLDHGGVVFSADTDTGSRWFLLDSAGKELVSLAGYHTVAVNEEGNRILATGMEGVLRILDSTGRLVVEKKTAHSPVGMIGDVVFAQSNLSSSSMAWNIVTGETRTFKGVVRDVNAARGLVLVLDAGSPNPNSVCYSVLDANTLAVGSRACGPLAPVSFSKGGTYVIATGTFDGGGPMSLALVRVEDGRVALEVDDSVGAWSSIMNNAETALTFSASESGPTAPTNNALVRCELSGACTVVGDSRKMSMVAGLPAAIWTVAQN